MGLGDKSFDFIYWEKRREREIRQIRKKIKTTVSEDKNVKDVRRFFTECLAGADKDNTIEVWFS